MTNQITQKVLNNLLETLLNAQIAEDDNLPCKSVALTAKAILKLNLYCSDQTLTVEQKAKLNEQMNYI